MIIAPFSVREICSSGEEVLVQPFAVQNKINLFKQIFHGIDSGTVALRMERSLELICAVAALVELHIPFTILCEGIDVALVGAYWIFDGKQLNQVSDTHTGFYATTEKLDDMCYIITTSGTTGSAKVVGVPYSCIGPNIDDFRERFSITSTDVVLCSTSFCFDPSVVELFLCFTSGAQLLLVPDSFRSQPHLLANILRKHTPSFVQLTPTVLSFIDEVTLTWIFGDFSPVRYLLIGGESFPLRLVNRYRTPSNPTRIFNVYGVTEVSCWATISEVPFGCNFATLGSTLKCTTLSVADDNELLIGGSRRCCVNGVWSGEFTATGDLVDVTNGEIALTGRKDDQVKLNGIRCDLLSLSQLVLSIVGVVFAQFAVYKEKFLVLLVDSNLPIEDSLPLVLPSSLLPSKVIYVDKVPINRNGKVDQIKLRDIIEEQCSKQTKTLSSITAFLSKFGITQEADFLHSFAEYAAEIALHLDSADAMRDILNPGLTIQDVVLKHTSAWQDSEGLKISTPLAELVNVSITTSYQPDIVWAYDTEKCIDGSPLLTMLSGVEVVAACSHSGVIVCIRVHDGFCLWKRRVHCRFESSLVECDKHFVVGGYDGGVYFLLANNGEVAWRFACGDTVKATCAVGSDGHVYVPAYDGILYKLNSKSRKCIWSCAIQSGSPSTPVLWERYVLVTTIKGSVEAIDLKTGGHIWLYQSRFPIFSSIATFGTLAFFGCVDGKITSIGLQDGVKEHVVCVGEPVFARISIVDDFVYIVTERGSLFCADLTLKILRRFLFTGCTFVVPALIVDSHKLGLVSSSGLFILFNKKDANAHAFHLGADKVFSAVGLLRRRNLLLCGCRDDFLRCFKFSSDSLW